MIRINVLEGLRLPLPPATPREILEVCAAALGFSAIAVGIVAGVTFLLDHFLF